ncbi:MAG: SUMF1/EgtB/PvdO family nonheme iron enzyme, partial [Verrucomicrobiota bacterium]
LEAFLRRNRNISWEKLSFQEDDHPAVNVTWEVAVAFCEWLTEEEREKGMIGENQRYRLPSDHEWSCAVGIGKDEDASLTPEQKDQGIKEIYPWGRRWPPPRGAGNFLGEEAEQNSGPNKRFLEGYEDDFEQTAPVGSFEPSDEGLYDLSGNAIEWCQELYSPTKSHHALRGGHWDAGFAGAFYSSDRWNLRPGYHVIGFRCVLSE